MRARVPVSRATKREIDKEIKRQIERERAGFSRRVFKFMCYALHELYGFGKKRCEDVIDRMEALAEEHPHCDAFWEQLDDLVIGYLGLSFEREEVDVDGELVFDEEKR